MATRGNIRIADAIGTGSADVLQTMLLAGRPNQEIANAMGCALSHLVWALSLAAPSPLLPRNWVLQAGPPCPFPAMPWYNVAQIAYPGPEGGFTYGTIVPGRPDGT